MAGSDRNKKSNDKVITLDYSNKQITDFPLIDFSQLQFLYLENNDLRSLPQYLFLDAPSLKWLDVRNNQIERIPESIENHFNVETMLLQNNRISYLPIVLGTVKSLKCLQLSGNPIIYPKRYIINAGVEALLNFLNDEYKKGKGFAKKILDVSLENEHSTVENFCVVSKQNGDDVSSGDSSRDETSPLEEDVVKEKILKENKHKIKFNKSKSLDFLTKEKKIVHPIKNTDRYLKRAGKSMDEYDTRVEDNLLRDNWLKRRRELLNKREKVLQDRKSLVALKNWRKDYNELKLDSKKMYYALDLANIPYDTDLNYVKILTRADIEKDLPDKYKKNIKIRSKPIKIVKKHSDMHTKIDEIIDNMNSMRTENFEWSPRTERKMISCEIKMLSEIKKQIDKLKSENDL